MKIKVLPMRKYTSIKASLASNREAMINHLGGVSLLSSGRRQLGIRDLDDSLFDSFGWPCLPCFGCGSEPAVTRNIE